MGAVEIYNTEYNLVQFRTEDQATADALVAWAKKADPDAKITLLPMQDHVLGRAQTAIGASGKHDFEERFAKALRAYIAREAP
jgi:uncharacterized iron-regulated membrane protein